MEGNPTAGVAEAFLGDLPPAKLVAEVEELLVNKEWVELCEQRRLPVKQKYQLQFRETMCLKTDVRKLIKQVHKLQKWMKKYKRRARKSHLMCEFYMHGYLLRIDREFNQLPYVGDIHLRAITSYTFNYIRWQKDFNAFESN